MRPYCYFLLSVLIQIAVFELIVIEDLRFAAGKKAHTYHFSH